MDRKILNPRTGKMCEVKNLDRVAMYVRTNSNDEYLFMKKKSDCDITRRYASININTKQVRRGGEYSNVCVNEAISVLRFATIQEETMLKEIIKK